MRLVTYSYRGEPRAGVLTGGGDVLDLQRASAEQARRTDEDATPLPAEVLAFLELGVRGREAARSLLDWTDGQPAEVRGELAAAGALFEPGDPHLRLHAPVPNPRKVLAIGLNYKAHAAESGAEIPEHPIVFAKAPTCIIGPGAPIHVPRVSDRVDWEGELCAVIGQRARHVSRDRALDYVAGYMNGNDVSVRDWQRHSATWMMGKSFDTHGPTGPWLATSDEIPDPAALELRVWVNDDLKQESPTGDLIFDIPALIEYVSTAFTLEPGDVIFTGTPSGVGAARRPQEWLKAGDTVRVEITGLGTLENPVIDEPASEAGAPEPLDRMG